MCRILLCEISFLLCIFWLLKACILKLGVCNKVREVAKFIHGLSFGGISSPSSQGLGLSVNVGLGVPQLLERPYIDRRLWMHAKLEMMIDLWQDKH